MQLNKELLEDLKASHFNIGSTDHLAFGHPISIYDKDYRKWEVETGTNDLNYMSTKQSDFIEHKDFQPSKLPQETMNELRNHHFNMGDWHPYKHSITHEKYPAHPLPENLKENKQQLTNKMRRHNFKISDGRGYMPQTSYGSQFKHIPPSAVEKGLSKEELQQKVINLRNTNMVLGQDKPISVSTMREAYQKLDVQPIKLNRVALQKTHFDFGSDPSDMQSVNRITYKAKQVPPLNNVEKQRLMDDLRSHHWNLGGEAANYVSVSRGDYTKQVGVIPLNAHNPLLQKTHFQLGSDSNAHQSAYQRDMIPYQSQNYKRENQARDQNMDRGTNWSMGEADANYLSENKQNFVKHPPVDLAAIRKEVEENKKTSVELGNPNDVHLLTEFQAKYVNNFDPSARGVLNEDLKNDLRASHHTIKDDDVFRGLSEYDRHFTKKVNPDGHKINQNRYGPLPKLPGEYITTYRAKYLHPSMNI